MEKHRFSRYRADHQRATTLDCGEIDGPVAPPHAQESVHVACSEALQFYFSQSDKPILLEHLAGQIEDPVSDLVSPGLTRLLDKALLGERVDEPLNARRAEGNPPCDLAYSERFVSFAEKFKDCEATLE
jgi:hypothetical protein